MTEALLCAVLETVSEGKSCITCVDYWNKHVFKIPFFSPTIWTVFVKDLNSFTVWRLWLHSPLLAETSLLNEPFFKPCHRIDILLLRVGIKRIPQTAHLSKKGVFHLFSGDAVLAFNALTLCFSLESYFTFQSLSVLMCFLQWQLLRDSVISLQDECKHFLKGTFPMQRFHEVKTLRDGRTCWTSHCGSADTLRCIFATLCVVFLFIIIPSLSWRQWVNKGGSPVVRHEGSSLNIYT